MRLLTHPAYAFQFYTTFQRCDSFCTCFYICSAPGCASATGEQAFAGWRFYQHFWPNIRHHQHCFYTNFAFCNTPACFCIAATKWIAFVSIWIFSASSFHRMHATAFSSWRFQPKLDKPAMYSLLHSALLTQWATGFYIATFSPTLTFSLAAFAIFY